MLRLTSTTLLVLLATACGDDGAPTDADTSVADTAAPDTGAVDARGDTGSDAGAGLCDPATGLARPLPTCNSDYPCVRLGSEVTGTRLEDPSPEPRCDDPELELWTDTAGEDTRYACVARPDGAGPSSRRPLVLYFHPGGEGGADTLSSTQLVARHESYDLSADPTRPGFVLAAIHGRNLHHPTVAPRDGRHHDFYYRDLSFPSSNPDVAVIDRLVASLADEIDPDRVYVMGWSNGGFFGQMYAIARHAPTGAGFRVAAASVFATGNPFGAIEHDPFTDEDLPGPRCALDTIPSSDVPIQLVYRTCDFPVPCGDSQSTCFGEEPSYQTSRWLAESAAALDITPTLIAGLEAGGVFNADATECHDFGGACPPMRTAACATTPMDVDCQCFFNHQIWPDGVRDLDGSRFGQDREADMLDFLRGHQLTP